MLVAEELLDRSPPLRIREEERARERETKQGARRIMGRGKKAKPLPYNVYKMATSCREILTSKSRGIWRLEKYCFLYTDFVKWRKKKISWKFICTFFGHTVSGWKPFHLCYLLVPLVYNGKRQYRSGFIS